VVNQPPPRSKTFRSALFRLFGNLIARTFYTVEAFGRENLPSDGFLLVPNHLSYVDAVALQLACPRPIRFLVHESIYRSRWLQPIFRLVEAIPISNVRAKEAVRQAVERIKMGEIVCIFPEGELSRTGVLLKLRKGFELIAQRADCEVVPVWLDGIWGSIFSFEGGRYFFKFPKKVPCSATIAFGNPIPASSVEIGLVRESLLALGEFCYQRRPEFDCPRSETKAV
jgi:acyl-[acyl-carrier-protein]-phospholipid O-acyltransferase/long-chain-fatty-acid--[acyl-carrier-protein] ligase